MRRCEHRIRRKDFAEVYRALRPKNRRQALTLSPRRQELERLCQRMTELKDRLRLENKQLLISDSWMGDFWFMVKFMDEEANPEWQNIIDSVKEGKRKIEILEQQLDVVSRQARQLARKILSSEKIPQPIPVDDHNHTALAA